MITHVEHKEVHSGAAELKIAAGILRLTIGGIGPPFPEDAQRIFFAGGGSVGIVRAEIVIVPDRIAAC
jgi:hypothetical protein